VIANREDTTMPDPIARKRLKKKMLDRWENEGGALAPNTSTTGDTRPTIESKGRGKKLSSQRKNSTVHTPGSPTKKARAIRK
jgi:hypothetical protein